MISSLRQSVCFKYIMNPQSTDIDWGLGVAMDYLFVIKLYIVIGKKIVNTFTNQNNFVWFNL